MDAIREAEAAVPADELARWARDPIAAMALRRARPQRGRTLSLAGLPASIVALDRAWDAVFDDIRLKVETGAIQLTGRMARPDNRQHPEPIPGVWGRALDFDLRAGAIFMKNYIFVAVEAATGNLMRDINARDQAQELTLYDAVVQWCDPALVDRIREAERDLIAHEHQQYPRPKLTHPTEWRQPTNRSWMIETSYVALDAAWADVERDLRTRLVRGEFHLRGVMVEPHRKRAAEVLPGVWAADYRFDFSLGTVRFEAFRYVAVIATRGPAAESDTDRPTATLPIESREAADAPVAGTATNPTPRIGGRPRGAPLIEQALREHWNGLHPAGAPEKPESWLNLSLRLIARVKKARPKDGALFPKEETVRKHLPEIYARLLVEKGGPRASDQ